MWVVSMVSQNRDTVNCLQNKKKIIQAPSAIQVTACCQSLWLVATQILPEVRRFPRITEVGWKIGVCRHTNVLIEGADDPTTKKDQRVWDNKAGYQWIDRLTLGLEISPPKSVSTVAPQTLHEKSSNDVRWKKTIFPIIQTVIHLSITLNHH